MDENNEIEQLFDDDNKVSTPINNYTDVSRTSDIVQTEKIEVNKLQGDVESLEDESEDVDNSNVINKETSFSRNTYVNESINRVKVFEHRPHYEFKFNFKAFIYLSIAIANALDYFLIAIALYVIFVPNFLGKLYDDYIASFFMRSMTKAIEENTEILIPLLGLYIPLLTFLMFFVSLIGFYFYNFLFHNEKMEFVKDFIYKSLLYTTLLAIVLVTLYRFTKIDVVTPIIKVLTFGKYSMSIFPGI